jgi:hypothetical protein
MSYKWRPSASAKREFAQKMNSDVEFANAYKQRKLDKAIKRRSESQFDYDKAGGNYVPTRDQYDFCMSHMPLFTTSEQKYAANQVIYGFSCSEKVHHDYIHIVNEVRRGFI